VHSMTQVIGIDPGLVHTGVVSLMFNSEDRVVTVQPHVVDGPDAVETATWIRTTHTDYEKPYIFGEKYVPRQHLNSDERMVKAEAAFLMAVPRVKWLRNQGVRSIVTQPLMESLEVWQFTAVTHHQDLRAAARVALYGMCKVKELNGVLADYTKDLLDGDPWEVMVV